MAGRPNAAQRHAIQQRSTDAVGFADALRSFGIRTQQESELLLEATAVAVYESVVNGSPITNSPGQPVATGELRDSWRILHVAKSRIDIFTNSPYARAIEHNWRRISRAQFKAAAAKMGLKRLTKKNKALIRKRFSGLNFRGRGGAHSVALTVQHFPQLVAQVVAKLFPNTSRNIAGGVRASGLGINVGNRSGAS